MHKINKGKEINVQEKEGKEKEKQKEKEKNEKNERKEEEKRIKSELALEKKKEVIPCIGKEVPYPLVPTEKDKE